ncbi:hypothetical protein ACQ4PT_039205 [Festuca glaucescens]
MAAAPPETLLPSADDPAYAEEEEQCPICRFPAEADRPLRRPCACRGSIQFVHDECQLQWMAIRHERECEVFKRLILTRPVYAADTPARLPLWEFMLGAPNRIMGLLLSLFFAACVLRESVVRLTTLWSWRVAFARTFAQVHHLLSLGLSTTSISTLIPLWVLFAQKFRPSAVAPFTRWVQRMEAPLHGLRGFDGLQAVALGAVEGLLWIFIVPLLIGMLVDLSLLSPFIGPDDDVPAVGFFCTWFLGRQLQNIGNYLAPRTRFSPYLPFVAYFIDEGHYGNVCLSREVLTSVKLMRLLQDELLPVATKLVAALGVPYVLAKCIFPILGYPVTVNLVVYRFAWLGSLTFCVLCIKLHGSIRNDRYAIGRRLEDVDDTCWKTLLLGLYFE